MLVRTADGQVVQYPYTISDLRQAYPNVSFPENVSAEVLERFGVYPVTVAPAPEYNFRTQRLVECLPVLVDGVWTANKVVVEKEQAQIDNETNQQKAAVRADRDRKLAQTDWMALSDNTLTQDWAAYRQALRDLPSQEGFPYNVVWPEKPE